MWELQILMVLLFKVVFGVALSAYQRAHLLMAGLAHVLTGSLPSLIQSGTSRTQIHRAGIVAVGAAHRVHYFRSPVAPFSAIVGIQALLTHQAEHIRTLTGPASTGLHVVKAIHSRAARAQNLPQVVETVAVTTGRIIVTREGIAGPVDNNIGVDSQHVAFVRAVIHALEGRIFGHGPCLILTRIVLGELLVLRDDGVGKHRSLVVEYAYDLGPTFEQRGTNESKNKNNDHSASKEEPSLPFFQLLCHIN